MIAGNCLEAFSANEMCCHGNLLLSVTRVVTWEQKMVLGLSTQKYIFENTVSLNLFWSLVEQTRG